ncbi:Asp-tRNA(Asn)/Glu-tRNA(Gln) amidotransferase subunit GatC [Parvicella tangerina]|uniref:Aspartyl/glutamyl-tRNA(Asn/Gln) amidotransferase subunit C n=1 Tax=Parvicella tangerina TaxID=2829795 RepID=A0A916JPD0_9FLAO|nr:Asp-tRNA(Asn)/Glu-tRNA(Gln) amidotransferase subunit GatC [Parvicella tangerina]CAG5085526.1 Glutamyl-tRNA(Gln) amidotransferase subunit C [Parvicella tangerina]
MKLDDKTVTKIASLAKLEFNGKEKEAILEDMNKMLDFVGKLEEVDTDGVAPLIHMTDEKNVLREDISRTDITQKEALKNAPKKDSTYFKIPKVIK